MTTVAISPLGIQQFFANNGQPNVGGTVLTQVASVNYPTYQDYLGATPLPNPIPLNSRGEVSNASGVSCSLFLEINKVYVFTQYDAAGNQLNQSTHMVSGVTATVATGGTGRTDGVGLVLAGSTSTSIGNAYSVTTVPSIASLVLDQMILFTANSTNTGASTLNVNGIGAVYMQLNGAALRGGEVQAQAGYWAVYDGTGFQIMPINTPGITGDLIGPTLPCTVGGTANAITLTALTATVVLQQWQCVRFQATATNTGDTTITLGSMATKHARTNGVTMQGGEIQNGVIYDAVYDGTYWQVSRFNGPAVGLGTTFTAAAIYKNSWVDNISGYQVPAYFKDAQGFVHLTGTAYNGTATANTIMATLPSGQGLFPVNPIFFATVSNSVFGFFEVDASGNIRIQLGSTAGLSFDGATWAGTPGT